VSKHPFTSSALSGIGRLSVKGAARPLSGVPKGQHAPFPSFFKSLSNGKNPSMGDQSHLHRELEKNGVVERRYSTLYSMENVDLEKMLGDGAFGKVYKGKVLDAFYNMDHVTKLSRGRREALRTNGKWIAVKCIAKHKVKTRDLQKQLAMEITVHKLLEHPNIINFLDFTEDDKHVYLFLEYASNGDLHTYAKKFKPDEQEVASIMYQVGQAIDFCHSYDVVHRDLKPENILMTHAGVPKLTDFGYCDKVDDEGYCQNDVVCGTTDFMAPEMVKEKPCGFPVDVWAFGVIIFDLLTGYAPFYHENREKTYGNIVRGRVQWPTSPRLLARLANVQPLLEEIFTLDPDERPTMEQVLLDDWIRGR
jgi:serine/threonine protein kinase